MRNLRIPRKQARRLGFRLAHRLRLTQGATVSEPGVVLAMRNLSAVWNEMFPEERCRLVRLLIARIQL